MAKYIIKRKKAPLGAAAIIPLVTSAIGVASDIFGGIAANKRQAEQIEEQRRQLEYQNKLNSLGADQQSLNAYFNTQNQSQPKIQAAYKHGGYITNVKGGKLVDIGGGKLGVIGRTHKGNGVKFDFNLAGKKVPVELEGNGDNTIGEVIEGNRVYSNKLPLYAFGGETPASIIKRRPNDNQLADYIFALQENEKDILGLNDDGTRKAISEIPPVGRNRRIKGKLGLNGYNVINDWWTKNGQNVMNQGRTSPVTFDITGSLTKSIDSVNSTMRDAAGKLSSGNSNPLGLNMPWQSRGGFNKWFGATNKPIDYINLAAGIGLPLLSRFTSSSNANRISDLYGQFKKDVQGMRYTPAAYIDPDTSSTDWAKHAALERTSRNALRDIYGNTASAATGLNRGQDVMSNNLIEHNKIFDENRKENAERRFQSGMKRNEFNLQNAAAAADFEAKKMGILGDITNSQAGYELANIEDNRGMYSDIAQAITNFGQTGMDRQQDEKLFVNSMLMNLMNVKDDAVLGRINQYFPGMIDYLRNSPYSLANRRGLV